MNVVTRGSLALSSVVVGLAASAASASATVSASFNAPGCSGVVEVGPLGTASARIQTNAYCSNYVANRRIALFVIRDGKQVYSTSTAINQTLSGSGGSLSTSWYWGGATMQGCAIVSTPQGDGGNCTAAALYK